MFLLCCSGWSVQVTVLLLPPREVGLQIHAPCPSKSHFLLVFQKSGFDEPEIMEVEQIVGAFHLDCKANFITVESLTPIHWLICSEGFKLSEV